MQQTTVGKRRGRPAARATAIAMMATLMGMLGGCAAAEPEPAAQPTTEASTPSPTPTPEPTLTVADIGAAVMDAEWSFAPGGVGDPFTVAIVDGAATDEYGRLFAVGEPIAGDANGDGIVDAAIPISMTDGMAFNELWYVWLGGAVDAAPTQVVYPIAQTTRCGDGTRSIAPVDGGFEVQIVLRMPYTDDARSCAEGGTGELTRTISVEQIGDAYYPVQSAPVAAWGGVCPPTMWMDTEQSIGIAGRAAPPAEAPLVIDPAQPVAAFGLGETPLMTATGVSFFGFIQGDSDAAVKMHCAFAD